MYQPSRQSRLMIGTIIVFLATCFSPIGVLAAQLTPDSSDLLVTPGEMAVATITVKNNDTVAETFDVDFMRVLFGVEADSLHLTGFLEDQRSWLSASPAHFSLEPGASQALDVTVLVPKNLSAQTLTVAALVKAASTGQGIVISPALASILFLHIGTGLEGKVTIKSYNVLPGFSWGAPITVTALFKNDGTDTVVLPSSVLVKNFFGRTVDQVSLSTEPKRIPPKTYRSLSMNWPVTGFQPFLFGDYTFELVDGDRILASGNATFVSWPFAAALSAVCVALILGILKLLRRRRKLS